ncbi:MAG: 2-amino-4-hydroxy-6-hydroxymethyldihydropteridine diphosphokinase [Paludibacteraceae bacterium]
MSLVFLGLGTNLGNRPDNLNQAVWMITVEVGEVYSCSSFYESKPWGFQSEYNFLNAVVLVNTPYSPEKLLEILKKIESHIGREPHAKGASYKDRIIDIDILIYENRIINRPNLTIPHPHIAKREFVLVPLAEIAPDLIIPMQDKTAKQLKEELLLKNDEN